MQSFSFVLAFALIAAAAAYGHGGSSYVKRTDHHGHHSEVSHGHGGHGGKKYSKILKIFKNLKSVKI